MKIVFLLLLLVSLHLVEACFGGGSSGCRDKACYSYDDCCSSYPYCDTLGIAKFCTNRAGKRKRSESLFEENNQFEGFGSILDGNYCKRSPCVLGQGDCDEDSECAGNLVCGLNNCRNFTSAAFAYADCCYQGSNSTSTTDVPG